jgi:putative membrane protein
MTPSIADSHRPKTRGDIVATLAALFVGLTALIHIAITVVEMVLWTSPKVYERLELGLDQEEARKVAPIVKNVGLYNGFLVAGLVWGLFPGEIAFPIRVFFLSCVIIAGIFGALTLPKPTTLVLQSLPATIALVLTYLARSNT